MNRKNLFHLVAAVLILLGVLGTYAAWYSFVASVSNQASTLKTEIQTKADDTKRIAQARSTIDLLHNDESIIGQYFVSINDVVTFLSGLQALGQSLGSSVEVLSVSADGKSPRGHLALSLKISGSFDSVMRTLGAIEYGPRDMRLVDLTLDTPVTQISSSTESHAIWTAATIFTVGTASLASTTPH